VTEATRTARKEVAWANIVVILGLAGRLNCELAGATVQSRLPFPSLGWYPFYTLSPPRPARSGGLVCPCCQHFGDAEEAVTSLHANAAFVKPVGSSESSVIHVFYQLRGRVMPTSHSKSNVVRKSALLGRLQVTWEVKLYEDLHLTAIADRYVQRLCWFQHSFIHARCKLWEGQLRWAVLPTAPVPPLRQFQRHRRSL
jgi:hypothetical protein